MRKPTFCIYENEDADQLCGNRNRTADVVGNPEDRFSHNEAHIKVGFERCLNCMAVLP